MASYHGKRHPVFEIWVSPVNSSHTKLNNLEIQNHFSALQYPSAVNQYLKKEMALCAILSPVGGSDRHPIHCSLLLTRPKDLHKCRVIMDLSYPKGGSVNDFIDKQHFYGYKFTMIFPTIDDLTEEIKKYIDTVCLLKIDVARAFCNLRIDSSDAFNLGFSWLGQTYIDCVSAFWWMYGSAPYHLVSNTIAHFMHIAGHKMFPYIDNYILVTSEEQADRAFKNLGLLSNLDKRTPPTKVMTCFGIRIDTNSNIDQEKLETKLTDYTFKMQ